MKLKNEQKLGSLENNNVSLDFEKHNDDLNPFVKSELEESLSSLPLSSFPCPTCFNSEHDK